RLHVAVLLGSLFGRLVLETRFSRIPLANRRLQPSTTPGTLPISEPSFSVLLEVPKVNESWCLVGKAGSPLGNLCAFPFPYTQKFSTVFSLVIIISICVTYIFLITHAPFFTEYA
ncbi:hypothetical protein, partial [Burkholderia contaminans]